MANRENFKSILDMGFGAIKERADCALAEIVKNITDPNTDAKKSKSAHDTNEDHSGFGAKEFESGHDGKNKA